MTEFTPLKKTALSFLCAFLLIIYVPVACIVGSDAGNKTNIANAETNTLKQLSEVLSEDENISDEMSEDFLIGSKA